MTVKLKVGQNVKYVSGLRNGEVRKGYGVIAAFDEENNPIIETPQYGKVTVIVGGLKRAFYPADSVRPVSTKYLAGHKVI